VQPPRKNVRAVGDLRFEGADEAGLCLSTLCLLHCLTLPFLLVFAPTVGAVLAAPLIHELLAVLAVATIGFTLVMPAIGKCRWVVVGLGSVGALVVLVSALSTSSACCSLLAGLLASELGPADIPFSCWIGLSATPVGCVLIGSAHLLQRRSSRAVQQKQRPERPQFRRGHSPLARLPRGGVVRSIVGAFRRSKPASSEPAAP
jgi:hypothetical protein